MAFGGNLLKSIMAPLNKLRTSCSYRRCKLRLKLAVLIAIGIFLLCILKIHGLDIRCLGLEQIHANRSLKESIDVYKGMANRALNKSRPIALDSSEFDERCTSTVPDTLYQHHYCSLYTISRKPKQICNHDTDLFVVIFTSRTNYQTREILRKTILSPFLGESRINYVFLVGQSKSNLTEPELSSEFKHYDDIVVGNFVDHYDNLTFKSLFMLKLAGTHCQSARFVLKLDEDVFINIAGIYEQIHYKPYDHSIYGYMVEHAIPDTNPTSKSFSGNFHESFYPRYAGGPWYILTMDLAVPIFVAAMNQPFLRIEDVFVTGVCAQNSNITITYICADDVQPDNQGTVAIDLNAFLSMHSVKSARMQSLWTELMET